MPIYEYQCNSCGSRFEALQRMAEDPLTQCRSCSGPVHRVIQPVGIIFKGSGFYVTDSRKSGSSSSAPSNGKSDDGAKSEAKTESKAESKSDGSSSSSSGDSKPAAAAASSE